MGGCFSGPDTHGKGLCACVSGVSRGNSLLKEQLRDLCDCSVLTKEFCSKGEVKIILDLWDSKVGGVCKQQEQQGCMVVALSHRHRTDKTVPMT